jgi:hypothetical protein
MSRASVETTMSQSRRAILTTAAALPALAMPVIAIAATAGPGDPIYAAIEKYRIAEDAFIARCEYEDDLKENGVKLARAPGEGEYGRTSEMVVVVDAVVAARAELANIAPTTLVGLVAYLDCVIAESERLSGDEMEIFFFEEGEETLDLVRSLARSARALAVQS